MFPPDLEIRWQIEAAGGRGGSSNSIRTDVDADVDEVTTIKLKKEAFLIQAMNKCQ